MYRERWRLGGPYRIDDRGAWAGGDRSDVTGLIWPGWWRCGVKLWESRLFEGGGVAGGCGRGVGLWDGVATDGGKSD